jgi:hypothetical protein
MAILSMGIVEEFKKNYRENGLQKKGPKPGVYFGAFV